ncbi:SGNH/GDSL hydrolase family protein, partial [Methylobacterium mesophilicum]|uniref:SGNH/GDSL hydrolase family protein n=3 Tax=Methylobacterium mesophilicum TaxID=39956 RepID=UPI003605C6E2
MGENAVNIVVVGDSIGFGLVSRSDPWSDLKLHDQYRVENHSIGGATLRDMIGVYEGGILNDFDPKLNAGGNLLIIQAGTNDLAQGRSPSELYKDAQSLAADAHSAGFKVIIATILPREGGTFPWSAASENARLEYNDLLRKGRAGADSLADIASSQTMGSVEATGNSALYSDGLHPTAAAVKAYIEPIYSLALSGNLDSGTKNDGTSSEPLGTSSPATTVPPVSSSPSLPASGTVSSNGPTTPVSTSIGTGADQLIFKVSEFVYKAD